MATNFWSTYEVSRSGERTGTLRTFEGVQICAILSSQVDALAPQYDPALGANHYWPGAGGALGAQLKKYHLRVYPGRPNCHELVLYYQELQPEGGLRPDRAVLYVNTASVAYKAKVAEDYGGNVQALEGPVEDKPGQFWKVVVGSRVKFQSLCKVRIITCAEPNNVNLMLDMLGKTNNSVLSNVGNAAAGTLRFDGAVESGFLINNRYWRIEYHFTYDRDGFDQDMEVAAMKKVPVIVPAVGEDGLAFAVGKNGTILGLVEDGARVPCVLYTETADFSELNGRLGWY